MFKNIVLLSLVFLLIGWSSSFAWLLIPMDKGQNDHLKAYGVIFSVLKNGGTAYWLLNYRGGSFAVDQDAPACESLARERGVTAEQLSPAEWTDILSTIQTSNMEKIKLEKAPKIAVYTPLTALPWDDAVTLVLDYAEIPYDKVYDKEVLTGVLKQYDWLHLHHEDFTGQYSKFYSLYHTMPWYQRNKEESEQSAKALGFSKVSDCKKAVALAMHKYVENGGFLFAMCCATNTLEIALAALGTDIVGSVYDGDPVDPDYEKKLNFNNCMAFENFTVQTDATATYFDNIDVNMVNTPARIPVQDFELFDFSAKFDPVPTMLTQDHERRIIGFYGVLTTFNRAVIKKNVVIMGDTPGTNSVRYIHGVVGKGQFAYYGGHDPEDVAHAVGDKATDLRLYKNSPGYRLILNNVLFPAAEKKEKKT